jgi:multicomponent K+:H+ antiporter subunit E
MNERSRWLPHPGLSVTIAVIWLVANDTVYVGHVVLAVLFGIAIPRVTREFWPDAPRLARPGVAARLFVVFCYDVIIANFRVAILVLGPNARLRPAFLEIPLDIEDAFGISLLASMITLTPGTLSAHVRENDRVLVVHALDVQNADEEIELIKRRYEAPLREALGC